MAPILSRVTDKFGFGYSKDSQASPPGSIVYSIACYTNFTTQRTIAGLDYQRSSDLVPYQDIYGTPLAEAGIMYVASGNPVQLQKTSSTIEFWISNGTSMTNVGSTHAVTGSPIAGSYVHGITGGDRYYFCTNAGYLYSLKIDGTDLQYHDDGSNYTGSENWQGVCFDPITEKLYMACYSPTSTIREWNVNMSTGALSFVATYNDNVNAAMNIRGIVYDWRNQYFYVKQTDSNVYAYTSMSAFTAGTRTTFISGGLADASDTMIYRGYFYDTEYPSYNILLSTKLLGTDRCL